MYGLINGKIYTVAGNDWDINPVEAMAIDDDGNIAAVGTDEEIRRVAGNGEIRDLGGKTVLPGFIDGHIHVPGTSFADLFQIQLSGVLEKQDTLDTIREFVQKHPDAEEYFGQGYNPGIIEDDVLVKEWLDEITDKPVYLKDGSCHTTWLNSAAMKKCGIDNDTKTSSAGNMHRTADGELTGIFSDVNDIGIPNGEEFTDMQQVQALRHFIKKMNAWGYTSMMNVSPTWGFSFYRYFDLDKEELTSRMTMSHFIYPESYEEDLKDLKKMQKDFENSEMSDLLKMTTAKYMIDGVMEGYTAWLSEPYLPAVGHGDNYCAGTDWSLEDLEKSVKAAMDAGCQIHMHTIGDAAVHRGLDVIEKCGKGRDTETMRNVLTHLQLVMPEDFDRFSELGIIAAIQPFWHNREKGYHEIVEEPAIGKERAWRMYPAKAFTERGVRITSSGDYPISYTNNPLDGIRAGVTRNIWNEEVFGYEISDIDEEETVLCPEQRLSVKEMVEAYTINGAYEIFRDDEVGSLEPGKKADFVILSDDIMTADLMDINKAKVLETCFGGKTVYKV
ncbi:MAG: amidohydrolase [Clostridia bacterium]|nr:amidohydrolase [Clostridia bacterium]